MKFKLPSGELRWLSLIWAVFGTTMGIFMLVQGNLIFASVGLFLAVMTLGIWFQIRACAWILLVMYAGSALIILIREVLIAHEWLRLGKVLINIWFAHALFKWLATPKSEE